jgi:uncharacterized protein (TIGR00159 family)
MVMHPITQLLSGLTMREWLVSGFDVLIVYYVIYRTLLLIKGTRAAQMLIGIALVGAGFFVAKLLDLTTLTWLLDNLINYSIIFFIVIFQHDIRRGLMRVGQNLFAYARPYEQTSVFEEVIKAVERLATSRVGALVVLERDADLVDYLNEPGVEMDAKVSEELLVSIFLPDSENQLHDGAVIIKNLRIAQAGAVLPLSANARLDKALGTRHRAAIGVTEETDAVVVVVSEERGSISLCFGGNIARDLDGATLRKALLGLFQKQKRRAPQPKPKETPKALADLKFDRPAEPPPEPATEPQSELIDGHGDATDPDREVGAIEAQAATARGPAES